MGTTSSGSPQPDTGGFRVTQAGDRLVAAWRPPLAERVGGVLFTIVGWLGMPLSLLIDGKRPIISPATGQVDWILVVGILMMGAMLGLPLSLTALPRAWLMVRAEVGDDELAVTVRTWRTLRPRWQRSELVHVHSVAGRVNRLLLVGRNRTLILTQMPNQALEWLRETIRRRYAMGDRPDPAWLEPGRGVIPVSEYSRPMSGTTALRNEQGLVFDLPRIATSDMRSSGIAGVIGTVIRLVVAVVLVGGCFWVLSMVSLPNSSAAPWIQVVIMAHASLGLGMLGAPVFLSVLCGFVRKETVVLADDALISTVRHGMVRVRRSRPLDALRRLTVRSISTGEDMTLGPNGETLARLDAEFDGHPWLCLAEGHPRTQLLALAKGIAYEMHRRRIQVTIMDHPHRAATAGELKTWRSDTTLSVLETGPTARVQAALSDQSLRRLIGYAGVSLTVMLSAIACGAVWLWHHPTDHDALIVGCCFVGAAIVALLLVCLDRLLFSSRPGSITLDSRQLTWRPCRNPAKEKTWKLDEIAGFAVKTFNASNNQPPQWMVEMLLRAGASETLLGSGSQEQARDAVDVLGATLALHTDRGATPALAGSGVDWMAFASVVPAPPAPWKVRIESDGDGTTVIAHSNRELLAVFSFLFFLFAMVPFASAARALFDSSHPLAIKIGVGVPLAVLAVGIFFYGLSSFVVVCIPQHGRVTLTDTMLMIPAMQAQRVGVAWNDLESLTIRTATKKDFVFRVTRFGLVLFSRGLPNELWARRRDGTELKISSGDQAARMEWIKAVIETAATWRRSRLTP